jgi:hypothetical protein
MKTTTYFGFGIAPSMFPDGNITKTTLSPEEAKAVVEAGVIPCLNPSHKASIDALGSRFGITVPIPERAPTVALVPGDRLLVMGISGLPRLEGRHEYSSEEVAKATFTFSLWAV